MLKVNLTKQAKKFLENLPPKQARQLAFKIQNLRTNSQPQDSKKLINSCCFRVDSGEYRVIYQVAEEILEILIIDKRNDDAVYKKFRRL